MSAEKFYKVKVVKKDGSTEIRQFHIFPQKKSQTIKTILSQPDVKSAEFLD